MMRRTSAVQTRLEIACALLLVVGLASCGGDGSVPLGGGDASDRSGASAPPDVGQALDVVWINDTVTEETTTPGPPMDASTSADASPAPTDTALLDASPAGEVQPPDEEHHPDAGAADASEGDVSAAVDPSADWEAWLTFHAEREAEYARLRETCNHLRRDLQTVLREDPYQYSSPTELRLGLARIDRAAMAACLASLRGATCEQFRVLVDDGALELPRRWRVDPFRACGRARLGTVPRGGNVFSSEECSEPDDIAIDASTTNPNCGFKCGPRPVAAGEGEVCTDRYCPAGTTCWGAPTQGAVHTCLPTDEGAACHAQTNFCDPGLFCSRSQSSPDGVCRPVEVGSPCEGGWQCPLTLACVKASAAAMGTCQPGRWDGEPCEQQGLDGYGHAVSDCAFTLSCLSLDGDVPRCYGGSRVGQPCGFLPGRPEPDFRVICIEGATCEPSLEQAGRCVKSHQNAGGPCTEQSQCVPGTECRGADLVAACVPVFSHRADGESCSVGDGEQACVFGSYCTLDTPSSMMGASHCRTYRKQGEPCAPDAGDSCDFFLSCENGVCEALCR
jgi:hypothetical protein